MFSIMFDGGPIMWLLLACLIWIVFIFIKDQKADKKRTLLILSLGICAITLSNLAHIISVNSALSSINQSSKISAKFIQLGIHQSMIPIYFSLFILFFACIASYILNKKVSLQK